MLISFTMAWSAFITRVRDIIRDNYRSWCYGLFRLCYEIVFNIELAIARVIRIHGQVVLVGLIIYVFAPDSLKNRAPLIFQFSEGCFRWTGFLITSLINIIKSVPEGIAPTREVCNAFVDNTLVYFQTFLTWIMNLG